MSHLPPNDAGANRRRAFRLRVAGDLGLAPALDRRSPAAVVELRTVAPKLMSSERVPNQSVQRTGASLVTTPPDQAQQRIRASRCGCNRGPSWAGSLSLPRSPA